MIKVTILPFISSQAYNSGDEASDYMLDMCTHGFSSLEDVQVQQVPKNPLMYKDADQEQVKKVWGKGFTLYSLLPPSSTYFELEESDLIIIALHHTMVRYQKDFHYFVKDVIKTFKRPTVVVDGWDQPDFSPETAQLCPYFKRELTDDRTDGLPIFFAIPEEKFCSKEINEHFLFSEYYKIHDFSPMVPANYSWGGIHTSNYIYKTEEEYYQQYRDSYFGYCCKKGGIQTGRTLEIVANNCIPFFTDIESYPKNTMHNFPKDLCIEVKKMKGIYPGTLQPYNPEVITYIGDTRQIKEGSARGYINHDEFDLLLYYSYLSELKSYCRLNLTTKALAKYILEESL